MTSIESTIQVNVLLRKATIGDSVIRLTGIETRILDHLVRNRENVVLREELIEKVWGANWIGNYHTLGVHINNIRNKMSDRSSVWLIETLRGRGYRLTKHQPETRNVPTSNSDDSDFEEAFEHGYL